LREGAAEPYLKIESVDRNGDGGIGGELKSDMHRGGEGGDSSPSRGCNTGKNNGNKGKSYTVRQICAYLPIFSFVYVGTLKNHPGIFFPFNG
jgi:hypothetical protein